MRVQIDMVVDAGRVRMPRLEEFTRLFVVSHCNNFGSVPIEAMVELKGMRKDDPPALSNSSLLHPRPPFIRSKVLVMPEQRHETDAGPPPTRSKERNCSSSRPEMQLGAMADLKPPTLQIL
ncbi:unnamed protein product [Schistocephalus solidus]|uniref:Uncharacterized protein n=1 Tax=Schistocephalus solidus TaxID=70667 RepID=A0A183TGY7_SCHSO|nr:unnamed protein product [Schistocephalus solidus]